MSLEHAILGFLNYEPMTGYDLKKSIDVSVAHFWPAVQSQIYRTLDGMKKEGKLEVKTVPQAPRPPRKVYSLTEAGRAELYRWLEEPLPGAEVRLAWLIQLFFSGCLSDDKIIALLEHQLSVQRGRMERFGAIPSEAGNDMSEDDPRERFFWLLTIDFGVAQAASQVRWLEAVLSGLRRGEYNLPTIKP